MKIQSTANRPHTPIARKELAKEFGKAKDEFLSISEDHFELRENYNKWGTRIGFGLGAGVLVSGGFLVARYAPGLEGYGAAFPPVLAAAATLATSAFFTKKIVESKLKDSGFQVSRENVVNKRDEYRQALLKEVDDSGVHSITEPRWTRLKNLEDQTAPAPTRAEMLLLKEVDQLEFLADQRQAGGWMGKLAHAQDDPSLFQSEAETVVKNDGIHKVMVDSLGGK